VSLVLFGLFLFNGARPLVSLHLSEVNMIGWNALLSLFFFIQHSGMVRRRFRAGLATLVADHYHGVIYTFGSAFCLLVLVTLWQPSQTMLLELQGALRYAARGLFLLGAIGFAWGVHSLQIFDAFGEAPIKAHWTGAHAERNRLTARGAYQWVRHPLYFCALLLIWSCPVLTADRLFFNVLWSAWIFIGACLEERDLVAEFGDEYRQYQDKVPMLIPWRGRLQQGKSK
jgi:protein-S-isoprenylcysteine O-methyltransferase Ste14